MVFQNYALYPHMTVFDNLAFGLKLAKKEKAFIREAVLRAATTLGLEALLDRKPQALSGGQRQRVALGRAIVRNPKVFLFDEPLSNLDAKMRVQMRAEIARLHSSLKTTMIYVTHDQVEAMTMGDRICVMREGVLMQVADPLTLYRQPQNLFVAGFIGSPPMSLLPGRVESRGGGLVFVGDGGSGRAHRCVVRTAGAAGQGAHRPEDRFRSASRTSQRDGSGRLHPCRSSCIVEIAEPMGAESILYLKAGGSSLIGRAPGEHLYKKGEKLTIHIHLDKAHLFDAESENVITET